MKKKIINTMLLIYVFITILIVNINFDYVLNSKIVKEGKVIQVEMNANSNINIFNETLIELANEYDAIIFAQNSVDDEYKYYITPNDQLNIENGKFISNVKTDDDNQVKYLPFSNKERKIYIYNIEDYKISYLDNINIFIKNTTKIDEIVNQLNEKGFPTTYVSQQIVIPVNILRINIIFLIILVLLMSATIFYYIDVRNKELVIKKLLGYKRKELILDYLLPFIKSYLVYFFTFTMIIILINFYSIEQFIFQLIYNIKYLFVFLFPLIIMLLFMGLIIFNQPEVAVIKNKRFKILSKLSYFVKFIITGLFFVTLLMSFIYFENMIYQKENLKSFENIKSYYTIRKNSDYQPTDDEFYNLYYQTEDKYNGLLIDANNVDAPKNRQYICGEFEPLNICDIIIVNENYLNHENIVDYNGQKLQLNTSQNQEINVLVSEKYKQNEKQILNMLYDVEGSYLDNSEFIVTYIRDDQKIPSYLTLMSSDKAYLDNPLMIVVDDDFNREFYRNTIAGSNHYFIDGNIKEINKTIDDLNLSDVLTIENREDELLLNIQAINKAVLKSFLLIILLLGVFIVINISIVSMYLDIKQQEIKVKYYNGYKFLDIYDNLIGLNVLIVFTSVCLANFITLSVGRVYLNIIITFILIILEMITLIILLRRSQIREKND